MKGTIKSKGDMERLFQGGRRSSSSLVNVLVMPSPAQFPQGRCAFIAGKKLGVAPLRSRCKRVMRASVQEIGGPWKGMDVAFVARRKVAYRPHDEVVADIKRQLRKLGVDVNGN